MDTNCGLCLAVHETYRIVNSIGGIAYSLIPLTPMVEGHAMVIPVAHKQMKDLSANEIFAINKLLVYLKEKLVALYPSRPPIISTHSDTSHASIPGHFHYHVIPSNGNLEKIMSGYDSLVYKKEGKAFEELEIRAARLRS